MNTQHVVYSTQNDLNTQHVVYSTQNDLNTQHVVYSKWAKTSHRLMEKENLVILGQSAVTTHPLTHAIHIHVKKQYQKHSLNVNDCNLPNAVTLNGTS